jgi:Secretion system C-terminal sorting domain
MYGPTKISTKKGETLHNFPWLLLVVVFLFGAPLTGMAITRTSVTSGPLNAASTWSPAGVPGAVDNLIIASGHTVTVNSGTYINDLTVASTGILKWMPSVQLTVNGSLHVNGTLDLSGGNLQFATPGKTFGIGATGTVIWDPADNTATGASVFINGTEQFDATSTLIIKKWYNFQSVPLTTHITGNFGNLTLTTLSAGLLYEWNQENGFETHKVIGKLTIDQGWIVLDNTGAISNTQFGSIELNNINSYLDFHSGDHPGSFTVTTGSITNIGGTLNGITNGDGNINLIVNGDFINVGYTVLIYNSGLINKGNGNATMQVQGDFRQPGGDFRGIFNLSTTNGGIVTLSMQNVEVTGGQFMGQYACHTSGGQSEIHIRGNLNLNLTSNLSRFRGNGLTSLGGTLSDAALEFRIDGSMTVNGHDAAEVTTSSSKGSEFFAVGGPVHLNSTHFSLNYGHHPVVAEFNGAVTIQGATVNLSKTSGSLTATFNDSLNVYAGEFSCKGENGAGTVVVNGAYRQTGGNSWLYSNAAVPAASVVYMIVNGNYIQSGGTLAFDSNPSSGALHHLSLTGAEFIVSDSATISSGTTNSIYGNLHFDRPGVMHYSALGTDWNLQQVKQYISGGCTLQVTAGNFQASSSSTSSNVMVTVGNGGILDLGSAQIYSNSIRNYSGIHAQAGSRIRISRPQGFYNGTPDAALNAGGNMKYHLDKESTVEYYGPGPIAITGSGIGTALTADADYGYLVINLDNNTSTASISSQSVSVRKSILLNKGNVDLNEHVLKIENGHTNSIQCLNGAFISEGNGAIRITKPVFGQRSWFFSTAAGVRLPFSINLAANSSTYLKVSTRPCNKENFPFPQTPDGTPVTSLNIGGNHAASRIIDRWYTIEAPGSVAGLTLSYSGDENTLPEALSNSNIAMSSWTGTAWTSPAGFSNNADGSGTVVATGISNWGVFAMVAWPRNQQADLLEFNAMNRKPVVDLEWKSMENTDARFYTVERSANGSDFISIQTLQATAPQQSSTYYSTDEEPLAGVSWYRLKQTDYSGIIKYSTIIKIENGSNSEGEINVISVTPNPFKNFFTLLCDVPEGGSMSLQLLSINGQVVDTKNVMTERGRNTIEWQETKNIPPGIYLMILSDGKRKTVTKLYKQ